MPRGARRRIAADGQRRKNGPVPGGEAAGALLVTARGIRPGETANLNGRASQGVEVTVGQCADAPAPPPFRRKQAWTSGGGSRHPSRVKPTWHALLARLFLSVLPASAARRADVTVRLVIPELLLPVSGGMGLTGAARENRGKSSSPRP